MNLHLTFFLSLLMYLALAQDCKPGTYMLKRGVCRPCPKGTFQAHKNKYACRPCPPRRIAAKVGSSSCKLCAKGRTPNRRKTICVCKERYVERDDGKCKICEPGTFFELYRGIEPSCRACLPGSYQPDAGQKKCLQCPPGTLSGEGATECVTCGEDQVVNLSTNKCETCRPGFSSDPFSGCQECLRNLFKPERGNGVCFPCPIGTFSNPGSKSCTPCPKGTTLFKNGECGSCPAGSFLDSNTLKCQKCQYNEFTPYKNVLSSCFACNGKKFAVMGATKCVSCPKNEVLHRDGTCKECPPGSAYSRYDLNCQKCRVNEYSRGDLDFCQQCETGTYSLPESTTCFECPEGEALILKKKGCGTCGPGRMYESYFARCEKCYKGSIRPDSGIGDCMDCPPDKTSNEDRTECIDK